MAAEQSYTLAEMDRRFASSERRSASRRERRRFRALVTRKATAGVGVAGAVVALGTGLSTLDIRADAQTPSRSPAAAAPVQATPRCPVPAEFRRAFATASRRTGVPLPLLVAMAQEESRMDPAARSGAGAQGLLQLMPATARELGVDPTVPRSNVLAGARYLRRMLDRFDRLDLALSAYNAGPTAVEAAGGASRSETLAYVANVRQRAAGLQACR